MKIRSHKDLDVYRIAFEASMEIFELTKSFPKDEKYSLTDQIRRSSRSVCANLAEVYPVTQCIRAFRKRKYPNSFVYKLNDCEGEAAETQVWLDYSLNCKYINSEIHKKLFEKYDKIIGKLVNMALNPEKWKY